MQLLHNFLGDFCIHLHHEGVCTPLWYNCSLSCLQWNLPSQLLARSYFEINSMSGNLLFLFFFFFFFFCQNRLKKAANENGYKQPQCSLRKQEKGYHFTHPQCLTKCNHSYDKNAACQKKIDIQTTSPFGPGSLLLILPP